jgi:NAD(P)-dependent dehydrogenase (short-subunit alcohol dehydrogenase family)
MMEGERGGAVVPVSSQMGRVGAPNRSVYCMTKHAVEGLTKAMAVELAPHGIRVNAIGPTFVETPLSRSFFADPAFREWTLARIPLGRVGRPSEVATAALFLASPAAAEAGRHPAPRRGVPADQRQAALPLARCRSRRECGGYLRACQNITYRFGRRAQVAGALSTRG